MRKYPSGAMAFIVNAVVILGAIITVLLLGISKLTSISTKVLTLTLTLTLTLFPTLTLNFQIGAGSNPLHEVARKA